MSRKTLLTYQIIALLVLTYALSFVAPKIISEKKLSKTVDILKPEHTVKSTVDIYKKDLFFDGYTLVPESGSGQTFLVNMEGKIIHKWDIDCERARLLPSGNLLVLHGTKWGKDVEPWKTLRHQIREYDWNGNVVWNHSAKDVAHHDVSRRENGNTLFLRRAYIPDKFKERINDPLKRAGEIRADSLVEVDKQGKIVWEWHTYENLDLNSCGKRTCRKITGLADASKKARDWTHLNTLREIPENKWFDDGDKRFKPGNLIILPRNWWTIFIVDKDSGKIVWEYEGDYKGGISGGHEAHMIPKGFPGAGNIMVLDNGSMVHKGASFVLEINPLTKKLDWIYDVGKDFWTGTRGSIQRLSNGNTLITEDNTGRIFEVTKDKELVWQYKGEHQTSRASRYQKEFIEKFL